MHCPRCGAEAPDRARYCPACGSALGARCPECGLDNLPDESACSGCGRALLSAPSRRFDSPLRYTPPALAGRLRAAVRQLEGERKHITVLFADLRGSTELLVGRDPEEARAIIDPVLELMIEAVHRFEGTVNQVMGDGIMALFGAPLAHEDHAIRACYAAAEMQESIHHASADIGLQIRVGLNSGEVVVRSIGGDLKLDYTAVGQTTHLAARMEQGARPGTVLLTEATARLAADFIDV